MTLLPLDDHNVVGVDLPKYKVPSVCCAPGCSRFADHAHHLWRRSFLGGDFAWVELPDHLIIGNLVPLCWRHHDNVTGRIGGHKARIYWLDKLNQYPIKGYYWSWIQEGSQIEVAPLSWQPPIHGQPQSSVTSNTPFEGPAASEICPGCQRPLAKKDRQERDPLRRRKSWSIQVPADTAEDGALVLDTLLEECARLFQHEDTKNMRYFTTVQALALCVQHGHTFVSESGK